MKAHAAAPARGQDVEIDIFCAIVGDAHRVHIRPTWLPDHLLECFDDNGEAFPVYLDFDDLDWHMKKSGVEYTKRIARSGSVQLYARGAAAHVLSTWLSNSFATGERAI